MNGTVKEWLEKAKGDYETARREFNVQESPNYDAVCVHAQQCVEKTMKAILIHHRVVSPRTHNLERLYELLKPMCPAFACAVEDLRSLTGVGVAVRYPGECADRPDAQKALEICSELRSRLLELLPSE